MSPDATPLDLCLLGIVKYHVYQTVEEIWNIEQLPFVDL